jgi:hypothetical protein
MTQPFTKAQVLIDQVRQFDSLAIDQGQGRHRQLFHVQEITFRSVRQDDGSYRNTYTIESEPLPETGEPWRIEFPAGTVVTRVLRAPQGNKSDRNVPV